MLADVFSSIDLSILFRRVVRELPIRHLRSCRQLFILYIHYFKSNIKSILPQCLVKPHAISQVQSVWI